MTAASATSHLVPPAGTSPMLPRASRLRVRDLAVRVTAVDPRLLLDQRPGELLGIERPQVLERLADPDQLHGDAQLGGDREGHPTPRAPVELGEDRTGHLNRV